VGCRLDEGERHLVVVGEFEKDVGRQPMGAAR
jgi:hypothetical protein